VATKKVTITIPEETHSKASALAKRAGLPFSTWLAQTAEHEVRVQEGLDAMREWETEHGALTEAEVASAESQLAEADATTRENRGTQNEVA
jgi:cytosine/adenosine deaminase-related metal-dependent hydrolase